MSDDPKWPLTSTKNNRLLYSMWYTKYDNCPSFPSWDIVFKMFSNSTLVDPKWPLTSTKNNRLLVLNVVHLQTKYEICPSFPSWDIVLTSRRHTHPYTHKNTHTYSIMITYVTTSSKPKSMLTEAYSRAKDKIIYGVVPSFKLVSWCFKSSFGFTLSKYCKWQPHQPCSWLGFP